MTSEEMRDKLLQILADKKTDSVETLSVSDKTVLADYFIIVTVRGNLQVRAIADLVEEKTKGVPGLEIVHRDGEHGSGWVVLDFGGVMLHIFSFDKKEYYSLDKFWKNEKKEG